MSFPTTSVIPAPAPAPRATTSPATTPPATTPPPRVPTGYLASTLGGVAGGLLLAVLGGAIGLGLMDLYAEPGAGLANLALLIYPLVLSGLGLLAGVAAGVRVALRMAGGEHATRTAWLTVPLMCVCVLLVSAGGLGLLLMLGVPAAARWIVLR